MFQIKNLKTGLPFSLIMPLLVACEDSNKPSEPPESKIPLEVSSDP